MNRKKNQTEGSLSKLVHFIKNYRIHFNEKLQFQGIKDTLFGWAIIALTFILRIDIKEPALLQVSFTIIFLSGAIGIFLNVLFDSLVKGNSLKGVKELIISDRSDLDKKHSHLTLKQRNSFIFVRALIATTGWLGVNIASIYFGYIDNSAIFGSDALFYTFLCVVFLGQKLSVKEVLGIFIAFSGILFILFYDISNANWLKGIICAGAALYSAISFSIIFFMTSIIVRHDSPKRVAFYQSLVGSVVSFIGAFFTISFFYENGFSFELVSWEIIRNSIILGLLYVTALHRFLRAFLYTEPVIIAVLGYTLPIFVMIFELFFKGVILNLKDIISIILITAGCVILVHEESKRRKLHKPSKPLYKSNLDH